MRTVTDAGMILFLVLAALLVDVQFCAASAQGPTATGEAEGERLTHGAVGSDCDDQLGFADALRADGDHYRAITEYKRFLHFCGTGEPRVRAQMAVGECAFDAGRYGMVAEWYEGLAPSEDCLARAGLLAGRALYRQGDYTSALGALRAASVGPLEPGETDEVRYYTGLSLVRCGDFRDAASAFESVDGLSARSQRARRYAEILRGAGELPRRSPGVAAALAVIPGAGYAYTGHYGTGVASAAVNGLLIWATIDAFTDGNEGAGGFYSLLALGFYVGNITGSAQSADRYNEFHRDEFMGRFDD